MVIVTIGEPTPRPTEPPEPTIGPTWTPTPTPVPPPLTLSDFNLEIRLNADTQKWTQEPDQQQINAIYATRMDRATFTVTNTGTETRKNLVIVYDVAYPITKIDSQGRISNTTNHASVETKRGTLDPGGYVEVTINSPYFEAMITAELTITANWDGGSMVLYKATLEPKFTSGTVYTPANINFVKSYGTTS